MSWEGVRERLAELAAADPDLERFGASEHEYRLGPPVPEAELEEFETRHDAAMPLRGRVAARLPIDAVPAHERVEPRRAPPGRCGAYFRLVVTGPERGRLWFDDRGSDGGVSPVGAGFREWYLKWLNHP
ncbi:hypothetical protein ACIRSS_32080 [Amycolatopsis sp. NPDC101161]|uniref:hypothetical protein n=1 Tax=Amycolatopsis sp. NPDC101161 TaxID=3363940 RepID=UPI00382B279C